MWRFVPLLAFVACSDEPAPVDFGGATYEVSYSAEHVWLVESDHVVHDLGVGQQLIRYDFDGDGTLDLGVFLDERDGFRETFAYLEVWKNDGTSIAQAKPVSAKWKDGRWVWIDLAEFPGLDPTRWEGYWFGTFMRARDEEKASWF